MKYVPKILRKSHSGVADIIGNLLVLAITVTLFSTVLFYVMNMPGPQKSTYSEFTYDMYYGTDSTSEYCLINVTMTGGQTISEEDIVIVLTINDAITRHAISDGGIGTEWAIGEIWSYRVNSLFTTDTAELMILDVTNNDVVYETDLVAGGGLQSYAPVISGQGVLEYPSYFNTTNMHFYAEVIDFNNDLDVGSIYVDLSGLNPAPLEGIDKIYLDYYDSTLQAYVNYTSVHILAQWDWNGQSVTFHAEDDANNEEEVTSTLVIFNTGGSSTSITNNYGVQGGLGTIDFSGFQGYNIYDWNDWNASLFNATPKRVFDKGDYAIVVVVSKYLANLAVENSFEVQNPSTKVAYSAVSSPTNEFENAYADTTNGTVDVAFIDGFYAYQAVIDTDLLPYSDATYLVYMSMRDSDTPNNIFLATDTIVVGTQSTLPMIQTFTDMACTDPSDYFYFTDTVYVKITIKNTGSIWDANGGDVIIRDYFTNEQLKRMPGGVSNYYTNDTTNLNPISTVWQSASHTNEFIFAMDLSKVYQSPWISGNNSYSLVYDMFRANNAVTSLSETYLMSTTIYIEAPVVKMDIAVGSVLASNSAWSDKYSLFFYSNDNNWLPGVKLEGVSSGKTIEPITRFVACGDVNGDGNSDIVTICDIDGKGDNYVYLYIDDGSWTRYTIAASIDDTIATPTALAIGNIDLDNDMDVIVGFSNGSVYQFRNNGIWTMTFVGAYAGYRVTSLLVDDLDSMTLAGNDQNRSFDVVAGYSNGAMYKFKNTLLYGAPYTAEAYGATGTSTTNKLASSEINYYGIVTNDYTYTTSGTFSPLNYEMLTEEIVLKYGNVSPSETGPEDQSANAGAGQLASGDGIYYTVNYGKTAQIDVWDPDGLQNGIKVISANFTVRYFTTNYDSWDWIVCNKSGVAAEYNLLNITGTIDSNFVTKSVNITGLIGEYTALTDLQYMTTTFTSINGTSGSSVTFDSWAYNITYVKGDQVEQVYTIQLSSSSSARTFYFDAARISGTDGDNFIVQYSLTGAAASYATIATVSSSTATLYTYAFTVAQIANAYSGALYIKVMDSNRTESGYPDDSSSISIYYMHISYTVSNTDIGVGVAHMAIADMDLDNDPDLIVWTQTSTTQGGIWLMKNDGAGNLFSSAPIPIASGTAYLVTISDYGNDNIAGAIGAGQVVGSSLPDIMLVVTEKSDTIRIIQQTSSGVYGAFETYYTFGFEVHAAAIADIDGDGRLDAAVGGEEGEIYIWMNHGDTSADWQLRYVDNLGCWVYSISVGRIAG